MKITKFGYISVKPILSDTIRITKLIYDLNEIAKQSLEINHNIIEPHLKVKPSSLHCTLIHDSRNIPLLDDYRFSGRGRRYLAEIECIEIFNACAVLKLKSDDLQQRFKELCLYGFKSDYPEYKPHITLTYKINDLDKMYKDFVNIDMVDYFKKFGNITLVNEHWELAT